jgi:pimeloyl-ACP methyl ester carboxylesterase
MPYIDRSGVKIYYSVHGSGTPFLLSHGFSASSAMWQGQIDALSKQFMLIVWDMRGHGLSDYPDDPAAYSEAHTVDDMEAILSLVCGPRKQAIVGGLSLGGYMSLAFYRVYPERVKALLMIDTGPGFKKDSAREAWNQTAHKTAERFEQQGLAQIQRMGSESKVAPHRNAKGLALAARGMLAQRNSAVIKSLPEIKVPSLVIVGADDTPFLAASAYMAKTIPGAKKVVIPGGGHAVNIDQPEAFTEAVLSYLASIDPDRSRL